jgi:hypothetical protein
MKGRTIKRYRIDDIVDFTSEAGLEEISSSLNEGYEVLSPKRLRTFIHARDGDLMCKFFELKHGETAEQWQAPSVDVSYLLTVEYNCTLPVPLIS